MKRDLAIWRKPLKGQMPSAGDWMNDRAYLVPSTCKVLSSARAATHIETMFKWMHKISATAGQVMMQQGREGDCYYLIEKVRQRSPA